MKGKKIVFPLMDSKIQKFEEYLSSRLLGKCVKPKKETKRKKRGEAEDLTAKYAECCNSCFKRLKTDVPLFQCSQCFNAHLCENCLKEEKHSQSHRFRKLNLENKIVQMYEKACIAFLEGEVESSRNTFEKLLKECRRNDYKIYLKALLFISLYLLLTDEFDLILKYYKTAAQRMKIYGIREKEDEEYGVFLDTFYNLSIEHLLLIGQYADSDSLAIQGLIEGYHLSKSLVGDGGLDMAERVFEAMRNKHKMFDVLICCLKRKDMEESRFLDILDLIQREGDIETVVSIFENVLKEN